MEELLARVDHRTGLDAATATTAIGHILAFLRKEGPAGRGETSCSPRCRVPRTLRAVRARPAPAAWWAARGMMGGGVMALGTEADGGRRAHGPDAPLGQELFAYGREKAGEDTMGPIVGAIPGLNQFV